MSTCYCTSSDKYRYSTTAAEAAAGGGGGVHYVIHESRLIDFIVLLLGQLTICSKQHRIPSAARC